MFFGFLLATQIYGITQLPSLAATYTGPYQPFGSSIGPSGASQKELTALFSFSFKLVIENNSVKFDWEGGYAEVYMGKLEDGNFVSIKRLTRGCREEMIADFLSELGIIVHVDHPNIARLIGYGVEGEMFLISDFGLAKWLPDQWTHHTISKVENKFGFANVGLIFTKGD
ncbi:hypothetical protein JHK85_031732 [Glycine max]|nr:hypothetical protein JHK85_031732 [Glycine max]KAG4994353.1 hypothetical protein JHK86_031180 [Glycine max]